MQNFDLILITFNLTLIPLLDFIQYHSQYWYHYNVSFSITLSYQTSKGSSKRLPWHLAAHNFHPSSELPETKDGWFVVSTHNIHTHNHTSRGENWWLDNLVTKHFSFFFPTLIQPTYLIFPVRVNNKKKKREKKEQGVEEITRCRSHGEIRWLWPPIILPPGRSEARYLRFGGTRDVQFNERPATVPINEQRTPN